MGAGRALELFPFRPVLDGSKGIVSGHPVERLARGAGNGVPFMAGTVLDEGLPFYLERAHADGQFSDSLLTAGLSDRGYPHLAECQLYPISFWCWRSESRVRQGFVALS